MIDVYKVPPDSARHTDHDVESGLDARDFAM